MRYLYGPSDEKYVPPDPTVHDKRQLPPLHDYKFRVHAFLTGVVPFDKDDVPILFKVTPDTLLNLASKVVDKIPLPQVYKWENYEVVRWIRQYGYPQYQRTFRENLINGRTLLLLDAAALSAMNIKNFNDIRHIAYGIRGLFFFEMTKFSRSISMPPEYLNELFKLYQVKTGLKFETARRTDLYRQMQLIRERAPNHSHWDFLENWLMLQPTPKEPELFGGVRRFNLYKCKPKPPAAKAPVEEKQPQKPCMCIPPCRCYWTAERDTRIPWSLKCLPNYQPDLEYNLFCEKCMPPCTCTWSSKKYKVGTVMTVLRDTYPKKYGQNVMTLHRKTSVTEVFLNKQSLYRNLSRYGTVAPADATHSTIRIG